jgi:hypothetical protein
LINIPQDEAPCRSGNQQYAERNSLDGISDINRDTFGFNHARLRLAQLREFQRNQLHQKAAFSIIRFSIQLFLKPGDIPCGNPIGFHLFLSHLRHDDLLHL